MIFIQESDLDHHRCLAPISSGHPQVNFTSKALLRQSIELNLAWLAKPDLI
jgi:hypothetical protein